MASNLTSHLFHTPYRIRIDTDILTLHEEGRMSTVFAERIQKLPGPLPRTVIEGQRHHRFVRIHFTLFHGHQYPILPEVAFGHPKVSLSGHHLTVLAEIISLPVNILPAGHHTAVCLQIISGIFLIEPAGLKDSLGIQEIISSACILPAGRHLLIFPEIIGLPLRYHELILHICAVITPEPILVPLAQRILDQK